jgi:hypothetical protein
MGCRKPFQILKQGIGFKTKNFKYFQSLFELGQTKINLNKLFEYFLNLELFKSDSNIQIQTKALNRGLLKWSEKRFLNEIWIFSKSKNNLGPKNKNLHAMKCNISNYSKNFLSLFRLNALIWQVLNFSENLGVTNLTPLGWISHPRFGQIGKDIREFCLQLIFFFPIGFFFSMITPLHFAHLVAIISGDFL